MPRDVYAESAYGLPPAGMITVECWCGGKYIDTTGGRDAHVTVFGHQPGDHKADVTAIDDVELPEGESE